MNAVLKTAVKWDTSPTIPPATSIFGVEVLARLLHDVRQPSGWGTCRRGGARHSFFEAPPLSSFLPIKFCGDL